MAFLGILLLFHPAGLSENANAILASTVWIAIWWISECIPIAATSLLPIFLFPLFSDMEIASTTASYGHKYIFIYIGGFMLALAIERWGLHRRIALSIIHLIGTNIRGIILGFMVATAFMSMWISNTATSVMMLPIAMAIVSQFKSNPLAEDREAKQFGKALMLAIAYSASIGGMATLVGTPPNLLLAGVIDDLYGIEITFSTWFQFGFPISVLLLTICWVYLTRVAFRFRRATFPGGREEINRQVRSLGPISSEELRVLIVFICTGAAWILRPYLNSWALLPMGEAESGFGIDLLIRVKTIFASLDDTIIAVLAGLSLFVLPAAKEKSRALLNWEEAVKLPWGILLLFGGGLAIAEGFKSSGLATWIGEQMTLMDGLSLVLLMLVLIAAINFLTEITSNLATTAMILPTLASFALAIDVHPYMLMVGATVAASCAFMLPVATPPNAVVFGSGYLGMKDMVKTGIWLNLISILILTIFSYWILPLLWDFSPERFPSGWVSAELMP